VTVAGGGDAARRIYLGPWRVDVTVRGGVIVPVPAARLARAMAAALIAGGAPHPASIGLILSDDDELARLDREHMGRAGPTDVLSFPLLPQDAFPAHPGGARRIGPPGDAPTVPPFTLPPGSRPHVGDVVISVERALAQAAAGLGGQTGDVRWAARDEVLLLVTHGTLHVCGWDHAEPEEEAAMRALERSLLAEA
jgi:probable rRNA maturation factor